ncbi:hypothetical protein V7S43_004883 [Phytophthora oleae]|uniref:RNase H type-1 domain-containing protein n=1 Tax=Phytophthora oleae TaxID=2107226 RepID=A0ABD3FW16_9STRA
MLQCLSRGATSGTTYFPGDMDCSIPHGEEANGDSGGGVSLSLKEDGEYRVEAVGVHKANGTTGRSEFADTAISAALDQIREITLPSTAQLIIQGTTPPAHRPTRKRLFSGFKSCMWATTSLKQASAAVKLIKLSLSAGHETGELYRSKPPPKTPEDAQPTKNSRRKPFLATRCKIY